MKIKGIIFDFNGTLLFDSDKHEKAWHIFIKEFCNKEISDEEFEKNIHGIVNKKALEYLYKRTLSNEEVLSLEQEKEKIYRRLVLEDTANFRLVPGAEELLDYICKENIPHTIATASEIVNLEVYIKSFSLEKWFDTEKIIYNDNTLPGKPDPAIYIKAAETIGVNPEDCLVFEDSKAGLTSAHNAGAGKIIAVASTPGEREKAESIHWISDIISNFYDFDMNILKK